jgi:hypothetical protein
MMTADGSEFVLSGKAGGLDVTRRVLVDLKRGVARYVEVFKNSGKGPVKATVALGSRLGGSCQGVVTSEGAGFAGKLGKRDVGIVTISSSSRPCVMFLVADARSKHKPKVSVQGNRTFSFTYAIAVKPGKAVSILHFVAQRRGVTGASVRSLFKEFYRGNRLAEPEVPNELRGTVVNFRLTAGARDAASAQVLKPVLDIAESLGVKRGAEDVLVAGEEGRIRGTASCSRITVETAYGPTAVRLDEVALLVGGAGVGRQQRIYLRDGAVLAGKVGPEGLRFTSGAGVEFELSSERLDMLFTRTDPRDGRPSPEAVAFVGTRLGERLPVTEAPRQAFGAVTAWGTISFRLDEVKSLSYVREGGPFHRLVFHGGTRIPVVLTGPPLEFTTPRLQSLLLSPRAIDSVLSTAAPKARVIADGREVRPDGEEPEWAKAIRRMLSRRVSFEFVDTPLSEAVSFLQALTRLNIIVDSEAVKTSGETPISLKAADMPLARAFRLILRHAGLGYALVDEAVFVSTPKRLKEVTRRRAPERPGAARAGLKRGGEESPAARKLEKTLKRRISFEFVGEPVTEIVEFLRAMTRAGIDLDEKAAERAGKILVSLRVSDMPLRLALSWVTELSELDWELGEEGILITLRKKIPPPPAGEDDGPKAPRFLLAGDTVLVGSFGASEIAVVTQTGAVPVRTEKILVMEKGKRQGSFSFELVDGSKLSGYPVGAVVPVRLSASAQGGRETEKAERTFEVPLRQVFEYRAPRPPEFEKLDEAEEEEKPEEKGGEGADASGAVPDLPTVPVFEEVLLGP